jgi:pimeloyl-ACP methyl ester carboxylesterase
VGLILRRDFCGRLTGVLGIVLACVGFGTASVAETRRVEGTLDGAAYRIAKPDDWNGDLVVYAHGYQGPATDPGDLESPPIDRHLTGRGYAWAASAYRSKVYRPDWFLADTLALRDHFIRSYGPPRRTIVYAQSMGGYIAVAALELHPDVFQGALIECGTVDGVGLVDWRTAYAAAAEYFSGLPILDASETVFRSLKFGRAFNFLMGTPGNYTEYGKRFDSVVKHLSGGDLPYRLEGMADQYGPNISPGTRPVDFRANADTRDVKFEIDPGLGLDDATLNRAIRRVAPAQGARSRETNPVFAEFSGKIRVPVLTIHATADFRVPFRQEQEFRRRTIAAGTSRFLVQRAQRKVGHCVFDGDIRERAFDDLTAWIDGGNAPAGDDVLGDPRRLGSR